MIRISGDKESMEYMTYITSFMNNLLWTEGELLLVVCGCAIVLGWWWSIRFLVYTGLFLLAFCFMFFRNPHRSCSLYGEDSKVLICPSDGKVVSVVESTHPDLGDTWQVAIFLSPLDVHVNWIPTAGHIRDVIYRPGKFLVAYAPKSSDINERMEIVIETENHKRIIVRQIAGFVARRIVCWVHPGDVVDAGDKYGMIKFGSRMEIIVPRADAQIIVHEGQRVVGGESVLGRWL